SHAPQTTNARSRALGLRRASFPAVLLASPVIVALLILLLLCRALTLRNCWNRLVVVALTLLHLPGACLLRGRLGGSVVIALLGAWSLHRCADQQHENGRHG